MDARTSCQGIRQYLGDSRARWEGDELVVETTNLTDKTSIGGNGNGLRHSDKMVITERFKRVAGDVIQYQFTVDDPVTYAKPFTMSLPLTPLDGGVILPTNATREPRPAQCDERGARGRQGDRGRSQEWHQAGPPDDPGPGAESPRRPGRRKLANPAPHIVTSGLKAIN